MSDVLELVLTRNEKLPSHVIQRGQWGKWSHVGIVDGEYVIEAVGIPVLPLILILFGLKKNSIKYGGVRKTPRDEFLSRYRESRTVYLDGDIEVARRHVNKTMFDAWGILGVRAKRRIHCDDKVFCSKLVAFASYLYRDELAYKATVEHIFMTSRDTYDNPARRATTGPYHRYCLPT